jgi:YVTN family beta-propeller protein
MIAIHATLMPDGRVLTFSTGLAKYDVWDPAEGPDAHLTLLNTTGTKFYCSSQIVLPVGTGVLISGGGASADPDIDNTVFDYTTDSLSQTANMNRPRWYSSTTTLLNGHSYIQGGTGGEDRPEVRRTDGAMRLLNGADTSDLFYFYPRNFVARNGQIFGYDGLGKMYFVDTDGIGSISRHGQFTGPIGRDSSSAMYRSGRILQFGGNSNGARIIDITGSEPAVTTTQPLSSHRRYVNATILANGNVLATGGSEIRNQLVNVNYSAEIWDPVTGQWTRGANGIRARLYHSVALLLPDASVLVAGGGSPGPQSNANAEIYYPPYLYDASGGWADRPAIVTAPGFLDIGQSFTVEMDDAGPVSRVALVKTGSVSHGVNFDQRFVELDFDQAGDQLMVQAPVRAADAPPGFYLLFALDTAGTPSIGRIVRVGVATAPDPDATPDLENPGNQLGQTGAPSPLQLSAVDPNGDPLTYSATGLPPGLRVGSGTGMISGAPATVGTFHVTAVASDGINADSEIFQWTISDSSTTFVLHPVPAPAPVLAGNTVTLEANVTGGSNLRYKWDFDDGTPETAFSTSPVINHDFADPGIYYVAVTAIDDGGIPQVTTVVVTVHLPPTANRPAISGNLAVEERATTNDRLWVVNQDNDSVSAFNVSYNTRIAEIAVGSGPRALAIVGGDEVWVTNRFGASISVVDSTALTVTRTIALPFASQPFGIAAAPTGDAVYVILAGSGRLLKINANTGGIEGNVAVGPNPRHVSVTGDGSLAYVSRFITRPLPGESTANVQTEVGGIVHGGEVMVVSTSAMSVVDTITLRHSDKPDFEIQGRGAPNYLGAVAISPDGRSAWVPSKQDNVKRGVLRSGQNLNSENTVRAISSRIDLPGNAERYAARIDHDDAGVASAIAHDRLGIYMFVALENTREVAVVDAHDGWEIFRINVGRAPQGLALSVDGETLYVNNFMDRTVSVFDVSMLLAEGIANLPLVATMPAVGSEKLSAQVLQGKRLFYDAKDTRLARDGYLSCASCHNDGAHDGRVWDMTGFGEGLRNTVNLRGRAGGQGFLHWSNNFDEVQDFEGQIRNLSGGTGLMTNAQFNTGTRNQPLGDRKAGISADLDALAAYVTSLGAFTSSPSRNSDGSLTSPAVSGREVFRSRNCASCHGGTEFTNSATNNPQNIGTVKAASGKRLGGSLTGIDIPTLRDAWATAPYLHDGSAPTLEGAIRSHSGFTASDAEIAQLVAYVAQIGNQETTAPGASAPNTGTGLTGQYFTNISLAGNAALQRVEKVDFNWSNGSPGPGVGNSKFSVRWSGKVEATATGNFQFQTATNDGVRLWINGVLVINDWATRTTTKNNDSAAIAMISGTRYTITMEYYEDVGAAVARLRWKRPGQTTYAAVPATRLYAN